MTNDDFTTEKEAVEAMALLGDEHLEAVAAMGADISTVQEEMEDECGQDPGGDGCGNAETDSGAVPPDPGGDSAEDQPGEGAGGGVPDIAVEDEQGEVPADEPPGEAESHAEAPAERKTPEAASEGETSATGSIADAAVKKLEGWKKANKHPYCTLICDHLIRRCREDDGFAQDVLQGSKTFAGCYAQIKDGARKMKQGDCACVEDRVVYEWAEDYIRSAEQKPAGAAKTKPEEKTPEKAKKGAKTTKNVRKSGKNAHSATENAQKPSELPAPETPDPEPQEVKPEVKEVKAEVKEPKPETEKPKSKAKPKAPKPEKPKKEKKPKDAGMDGQMDLFSLFG